VHGRLKANTNFWRGRVHSSYVLDWVTHGYMPIWNRLGAPPSAARPNHVGALQKPAVVTKAITDMLASGAIQPVAQRPWIVSPLNVIEQREKDRLVIDLTGVNRHLQSDDTVNTRFTYEGPTTVAEILQHLDRMFTVDLASAYHHVDLHPSAYTYMGFYWQGQYYVFKSLPFGLCTACWVFTKLMRELVHGWRELGIRLVHYLDDLLFAVAPDTDGGSRAFFALQRLIFADLAAAGLSVSWPKVMLDWLMRRQFLGFIFDSSSASGRISVSAVRASELQLSIASALARRRHVPARLLARICGQLTSMSRALGHVVGLYTRGMHSTLASRATWDSHLVLDETAMAEMTFWQQNFPLFDGSPLWPHPVVMTLIFSDASDFGWGGHISLFGQAPLLAQGYLSDWERDTSSTYRELLGLERTLQSFPGLADRDVRALTDNIAVVFIWRRGSRKLFLNAIACRIFHWCHSLGIRLSVVWIPRGENLLADQLSKYFDGDDWQLNPRYFSILSTLWGTHTVDRFASHLNRLCERFNSRFYCPGTEAVDAFSQDWAGENNWINPPFSLIAPILVHMRQCRAVGTLIVPFWPKRPWWPLLHPAGQWASFVSAWRELPQSANLFLPGPKHGNSRPVGQPHWRIFALRLDFS
jgi:PAS domain-containing protein